MRVSCRLGKLVCLLVMAQCCGCGAYTRATGLRPEAETVALADGSRVEFVGVPILGDYDNSLDLDFVLRVESVGRILKIRVHEDSRLGNSSLVSRLHTWINEIVDGEAVMVAGKFTRSHEDGQREYGSLALERIAFRDGESGFDEPYRTDPSHAFYISASVSVFIIFAGLAFR